MSERAATVGMDWKDEDRFLIRNVRLVDPAVEEIKPGAILIENGTIAKVLGEGETVEGTASFDGGGLHLSPGFIDMHVHLREPGQEWKEDVASGSRAARAGGFTAVACMPNTYPAVDEPSVVEYILKKAEIAGDCRVYPVAAATVGRQGEILTEFAALKGSGAIAISDDGSPVSDLSVLRRILEYSGVLGMPYVSHAEDLSLSAGGAMHEGYWSTHLGLRGIPREAEEIAVSREIALLRKVGGRVHFCHLHSRGSLDSVRRAKGEGLAVTAETAPHYVALDHSHLKEYSTDFKMNPPLGDEEDREALVEALADGTIDAIATDHAPHSVIEKEVEFDQAPFGVIGLETAFSLVMTDLVKKGRISLTAAVRALSTKPAEILGVPGGTLDAGSVADLTLFEPDAVWTVEPDSFHSKSRNSPFLGRTLNGKIAGTFLGGRWLEA